MSTTDDEKVWKDMVRDERNTDNVIYGRIEQLKNEICSFLDFTTAVLEGDKKTSTKVTKNGELIIKIEDVFQSRPYEERKKLTYFMKIDSNQEEEPKSEVWELKHLLNIYKNKWWSNQRKGAKFMKNKVTEKKIKSSVYYDADVSEMLQTMTEKYHLSRNRIHNIVLRKYLPEVTIWS